MSAARSVQRLDREFAQSHFVTWVRVTEHAPRDPSDASAIGV